MEKETDFARLLTSFFSSYLSVERGVSRHTLRSYSHTFTLFIEYVEKKKGISADKLTLKLFTRNLIYEFLEWLQVERNCSDNTGTTDWQLFIPLSNTCNMRM